LKIILCKGRFAGPISGADETVVAYAIHLRAAGYDASVAVLYPPAAGDPYRRRLLDAGVPLSCFAERSLLGSAMQLVRNRMPHLPAGPRRLLQKTAANLSSSYVGRCERYFGGVRPDLVHVVTPDPASIAIIRGASAAGVPVLYQELGTPDFLSELTFYYEHLQEVLPLCELAALSPRLAARVAEHFGRPPIAVLPITLDDAPARERRAPRRDVTFGFAGRLEYGKGPLALVDGFARVVKSGERVALRIAGDGPQRDEVKSRVAALAVDDRCTFTGTYNGAAARGAFMRSIDVFVLPTLAEGTPNSIMEAMAYGVPVIASAVGGIPDMIAPDTGLLVPRGDLAALAGAMAELARNASRREAMGRAARARYEELFSPAAVIPLLGATYRRLSGRDGGSDDLPSHPWANGAAGYTARSGDRECTAAT
jgi:glycosyltransferase involved in cell wall biosynthesis